MSFWKDLGKSIGETLEGMAEADKQLAPSKSLFESMVLMKESSAKDFLRNLAKTQNDTDWGRLMSVVKVHAQMGIGDRGKRAKRLAELAQDIRPYK